MVAVIVVNREIEQTIGRLPLCQQSMEAFLKNEKENDEKNEMKKQNTGN
jgi:hypothetical protein